MKNVRIVLADDHALFRAGIKLLLEQQPEMEVVGEATSAEEALRLATTLSPDILLLDLTLSDASGISILEKLVRDACDVRVIVVTMHDDPALVRAALALGAKGYLVKSAMDTELITAIQAVTKGRTFVNLDLSPDQLGVLLENPNLRRSKSEEGPLAVLSDREREVFRFLAYGHTNKEVAGRLDLSVKTVETYRARIAEKLGLQSRADFVRFAVDAGILTPGKTDDSISSGPGFAD